jgi:gentisate 1,2-dioxygenase
VNWETRDVFTLPHATWISHRGDETSTVFVVSDREVYRRLDMLTENYDRPTEGVR